VARGKFLDSCQESKADHPASSLVTVLVEVNRLFIDHYQKLPSQKLHIFTDAEYRKPVTSSSTAVIANLMPVGISMPAKGLLGADEGFLQIS
jgi:hypothetical protein